jgi:hypothetical protein
VFIDLNIGPIQLIRRFAGANAPILRNIDQHAGVVYVLGDEVNIFELDAAIQDLQRVAVQWRQDHGFLEGQWVAPVGTDSTTTASPNDDTTGPNGA